MFQRLPDFTGAEVRGIAEASFETWLTPECVSAGFSVQAASEVLRESPVKFEFDVSSHSVVSVLTEAEWGRDIEKGGVDRATFAMTVLWHDPDSGKIYGVDLPSISVQGDSWTANGVVPAVNSI